MNTLALLINQMGLTPAEAARRTGIVYATVWRHCNGTRAISAEDAVRYERGLGISRHLLRPDLWAGPRPPQAAQQAQTPEARP